MTDPVREALIEEIAKRNADFYMEPRRWEDHIEAAVIIVDALGLVTDRKLRIIVEREGGFITERFSHPVLADSIEAAWNVRMAVNPGWDTWKAREQA